MVYYAIHPNVRMHFYGEQIIIITPKGNFLTNHFQALILEKIVEGKAIDQIYKFVQEEIHEVDQIKITSIIFNFIENCVNKKWIVFTENIKNNNEITGRRGYYYPLKITIELTNRCHLQCEHCFKECSPFKK